MWVASDGLSASGAGASSTWAPIAVCRSRSDSTARLPRRAEHPLRLLRLGHQDRKLRQVAVPLDQRRDGAESRDRLGIELPDALADGRTMIVDAEGDTPHLAERMPGEMDFAHGRSRDGVEVAERVEAVVAGADEDIVHVEQQAAAG